MIGVMIITCAITMPLIVNSIDSEPKGPLFMISKYTINPTTTGGIPNIVRFILTTSLFPGNRSCSSINPNSIPKAEEMAVEENARIRVTLTASNTPTSENMLSIKSFKYPKKHLQDWKCVVII